MRNVQRETWVNERSSATSAGTVTVDTVLEINGVPLQAFDELIVHVKSSTSIAGVNPTLDLYLQRAIVPNPVAANDAHFEDFAAFIQFVSNADTLISLPVYAFGAVSTNSATNQDRTRGTANMTARAVYPGHWGDRIRIREKVGGTGLTAMVYSVYVTGIINASTP